MASPFQSVQANGHERQYQPPSSVLTRKKDCASASAELITRLCGQWSLRAHLAVDCDIICLRTSCLDDGRRKACRLFQTVISPPTYHQHLEEIDDVSSLSLSFLSLLRIHLTSSTDIVPSSRQT